MKRNYFYGLIKSFGIVPSILLALVLVLISYVSLNTGDYVIDAANTDLLTDILTGGLYALFVGFAVIGLGNLKAPKVNFADFIRLTGFLASIGIVAVLSTREVPNLLAIVIYAVILDVLLVELVIRFIFGRYNNERIGFKAFISSLCNRFNPVILAMLGVAASVVGFFFYDKLGDFIGYIEQYAIGFSLALLIVILLSAACRRNRRASLLDAVLTIVFFAELTTLIYWMNKLSPDAIEAIALLTLSTVVSLFYRGASFFEKDPKPSRLNMKRYYADLHRKYDVSISILIAVAVVGCFIIPSFRYEGYNRFLVSIGLQEISFTNAIDIIDYVLVGVIGVLFVFLFIFRKLKAKDIRPIDGVINILTLISLMIIPYIALIISNFTANMETIKESIPLLVVTIVFACTIVLSFFLQIIRYLFYCGEVVEKEEVKEEQEPVEPKAEVTPEDTPNEEVEEVVVVEEPVVVEEVEEEQPVYEEEVVEEVTEEPEEVVVEEVVEEEQEPVEEEEYEEEEFEEEDAQEDEAEDEQYEEESAVAPAKERDILMPEVTIVDENGAPKKIKRRFNTRMMFAPYEAKEYYNEIKNYLIMYRAKGRYSARCETFRYRGLVAKVALAGKSIKVCLAIDPQSLVGTKYHFKDVSEKKQYAEVPTMIKVRSSRGLKYFKELVDIMMANRGVKPKRNYEPTNFMPQLIPNGEAILATLGMSTDYLYPSMNARSIPAEMPDDLEEYLPVIQGEELQEEEVEASIYLDTLCNHFIDGDEITIDILKSLHIVTKGNVLRIKARGTLDRKLIIYAEYFEPDALKMLMCTNCTAIKIIR